MLAGTAGPRDLVEPLILFAWPVFECLAEDFGLYLVKPSAEAVVRSLALARVGEVECLGLLTAHHPGISVADLRTCVRLLSSSKW